MIPLKTPQNRDPLPAIDTGPCPKVLVLYYSYSGNTRAIAQILRDKTCGVLFGVETCKRYSRLSVVDEARRELETECLPVLKHAVPPMGLYDFVLVGGPVWWYTVPTPLMAFLREADFDARRVAAFCTHEGEVGNYFKDFERQAGNALVLDGLDIFVSRPMGGRGVDAVLTVWLDSLGLFKPRAATM